MGGTQTLNRDDNLSIFIAKFKVPQKLRSHIHRILEEKDIIILNYLAEKERRITDVTSKFPTVKSSSIKSLFKRGYLLRRRKKSEEFYKSNAFDQILKRFVNHDQKYVKLDDKEKHLFQDCVAELYLERMRASHEPVYRVIPIEKVIQDKRQLVPYHQAIYYLQRASTLSA